MNNKKGFGLGLGKMKELAEAFKKAQQVQEGAKQLQQDLENMQIEGQTDDGLVIVTMSGNQEPLKVEIKDEALRERESERERERPNYKGGKKTYWTPFFPSVTSSYNLVSL